MRVKEKGNILIYFNNNNHGGIYIEIYSHR